MRFLFAIALALLPAVQEDDLRQFSSKEGNFRLQYPSRFRKVKPPREEIQLALTVGSEAILVLAAESNISVEALAEAIHSDQKMNLDDLTVAKQEDIVVAGERGILVHKTYKQAGVKGFMRLAIFSHQGIAYRVIGVRSGGDDEDFARSVQTCLDHFGYLEVRKEWLEKFEGRPAKSALMGGLVRFELRRPRWTETLAESQEYGRLDGASFKFITEGAWVSIQVREYAGSVDAAVEDLRHSMASKLDKPKSADLAAKAAAGEIRAFELSSKTPDAERLIRGAVLMRDGIRLDVWMECLHTLRETVRPDWESLLAGLSLQSRHSPEEPLAFPIRRSLGDSRSDPGVAAVVAAGTRIAEADRGRVLGISSNGTTALVLGEGAVYRQNLPNGRRMKVDLDPAPEGEVAWSADGLRIAYVHGDQVIVAQLDPPSVKAVPVEAAAVVFGPSPEELIICTRPKPTVQPIRPGSSRLQVFTTAGAPGKILVDYPLCSVSYPALSPDGRRIAFVCNRDASRHRAGGHLYVAGADGSDLKQLTKDPEEIVSVAWASDGRSIFVVRRICAGPEGEVGSGGSQDLHRVPVDGGAAVNLTRCGRIESAWVFKDDVVLRLLEWTLPASQRGLFRVDASRLAKATEGRRVPSTADARVRGREVAARIQKAAGGKPLRDVVPTPDLLEKVAAEFAAAVSEGGGTDLDFSLNSLDALWRTASELDHASGRHPYLAFGLGAYYGETLRKVAEAEWALEPVPFGDWCPGGDVEGTPLVDPILPFSSGIAAALDSESTGFRTGDFVSKRDPGLKILLVYPPAAAEEIVRKRTGPEYYRARELAGKGDVKAALEILIKELLKSPKNRSLAVEAIALCEAGGLAQEAASLTERAVAGGIEVPEILMRHADALLAKDPPQALALYRKAAQESWPPAEVFIKLGKAYETMGKKDIAESCWRRAHERSYQDDKKREIRLLMGLPAEQPAEE